MSPENPIGWGEDYISQIFIGQDSSLRTTFNLYRDDYARFNKIEDVFKKLTDIIEIDISNDISSLLLSHSYTAFIASIRLASVGQRAEAYIVCRGSLEAAIYSHELYINQCSNEIWMNRHKGVSEMKNFKKLFKFTELLSRLPNDALRNTTAELYQHSIDMGAHPNPMMLHKSVTLLEENGHQTLGINFPNVDKVHMPATLKFCSEIGTTDLRVLISAYSREYDLSDLQTELTQLSTLVAKPPPSQV